MIGSMRGIRFARRLWEEARTMAWSHLGLVAATVTPGVVRAQVTIVCRCDSVECAELEPITICYGVRNGSADAASCCFQSRQLDIEREGEGGTWANVFAEPGTMGVVEDAHGFARELETDVVVDGGKVACREACITDHRVIGRPGNYRFRAHVSVKVRTASRPGLAQRFASDWTTVRIVAHAGNRALMRTPVGPAGRVYFEVQDVCSTATLPVDRRGAAAYGDLWSRPVERFDALLASEASERLKDWFRFRKGLDAYSRACAAEAGSPERARMIRVARDSVQELRARMVPLPTGGVHARAMYIVAACDLLEGDADAALRTAREIDERYPYAAVLTGRENLPGMLRNAGRRLR